MSKYGILEYVWHPTSRYTPGRNGDTIRSIIFHSSNGDRDKDLEIFTKKRISTHWYISKGGEVYHMVKDIDSAWHSGRTTEIRYSNRCSIGVTFEHIDHQDIWPDRQIHIAAKLVVALYELYGELEIVGHMSCAYPIGRRIDPAEFPWKGFHQLEKIYSVAEWRLQEKDPHI